MTVSPELAELHDCFQFQTKADALAFVNCVSRRSNPGDVCTVFLDDDRRIVELFVLEQGETHLADFVDLACSLDEEDVTGLLLVSDRTGQVPIDRPDDELTWQELVGVAADGGVTLYDWWVTADGRWAYSLPQFAPTPAQWTRGGRSPGSYGDAVDWARFAALTPDWPETYGGLECAALDPADEDDRKVGLEAAHPELHTALAA